MGEILGRKPELTTSSTIEKAPVTTTTAKPASITGHKRRRRRRRGGGGKAMAQGKIEKKLKTEEVKAQAEGLEEKYQI